MGDLFFFLPSPIQRCDLDLICFHLHRAVCAKFPIIKPPYQISWGYASEIPACRIPLATKWAPRFNPIKHADYKRGCSTMPGSGMWQTTKRHTYFAQAAWPWCAGYGRPLPLLSQRASWHFPSFLKFGICLKISLAVKCGSGFCVCLNVTSGLTSEVSVEILQPPDLRHQPPPQRLLQAFPLRAPLHQCLIGLRNSLDLLLQLKWVDCLRGGGGQERGFFRLTFFSYQGEAGMLIRVDLVHTSKCEYMRLCLLYTLSVCVRDIIP